MQRSDYFRLVAEIVDRWPNGEWTDKMIETWWPQFSTMEVKHAVSAVKQLQAEGYGPFTPDPGLVVRYAKAATPGGASRVVGAHAKRFEEMRESAAPRQKSLDAIAQCRQVLAKSMHQELGAGEQNASSAAGLE